MALYARPSWQLARQISTDVFVVVWTVGWWITSRLVHATIDAVAEPARAMSGSLTGLRTNMTDAAAQAEQVPIAGEALRTPFDGAANELQDLVAAADRQVTQVEQLATVSSWCVFLIPVLLVLVVWLPMRWSFHRRSSAAQRFIDSQSDLDLFALRAMANEPMHRLAAISDDPVGDWRDQDRTVIRQLAALELRRSGLRVPSEVAERLESSGEGG